MGQASMQRPQRMQGPAAGRVAIFSLKASTPLFCFRTGSSASGSATPIMGPPLISLATVTPSFRPQKSSTSRRGVPMMASTFLGSLMASPFTVRRLVTRGIPVARNLPMVDTVVTFSTITPASLGRPPWGTSRPVVFSMSTFSAPCG